MNTQNIDSTNSQYIENHQFLQDKLHIVAKATGIGLTQYAIQPGYIGDILSYSTYDNVFNSAKQQIEYMIPDVGSTIHQGQGKYYNCICFNSRLDFSQILSLLSIINIEWDSNEEES